MGHRLFGVFHNTCNPHTTAVHIHIPIPHHRKAPNSRSSNTGQRPENSSGSAATVSASSIQQCITEKKPAGDHDISGMNLPRAPKHFALLCLRHMLMQDFRCNSMCLQQRQGQKSRKARGRKRRPQSVASQHTYMTLAGSSIRHQLKQFNEEQGKNIFEQQTPRKPKGARLPMNGLDARDRKEGAFFTPLQKEEAHQGKQY